MIVVMNFSEDMKRAIEMRRIDVEATRDHYRVNAARIEKMASEFNSEKYHYYINYQFILFDTCTGQTTDILDGKDFV